MRGSGFNKMVFIIYTIMIFYFCETKKEGTEQGPGNGVWHIIGAPLRDHTNIVDVSLPKILDTPYTSFLIYPRFDTAKLDTAIRKKGG